MKRVLLCAAAAALLAGTTTWAQAPAPARAASPTPVATGVIAGVVQAADTRRPARRARVTLTGGDPRIAKTVTAGDRGEFSFTQLPPGDFMLSASKPGWLESSFGQKRPGSGRPGAPITLNAAQKLEDVTLPLARGGVITGVVLDEQGEAAFGVPVRAMKYVTRTGERTLIPSGSSTTDDRGVYRITGLLPGEYIVSAVPREAEGPMIEEKMRMEETAMVKLESAKVGATDPALAAQDIQRLLDTMAAGLDQTAGPGPSSGYAPVFYPGTTTGANASVVPLGVSEEKASVDLQLQIVPLARVTGTLVNPDGTPPVGAQVMLLDGGQALPGSQPRTARVASDGQFTFTGVQQGPYTIVARARSASPAAIPAAGRGNVAQEQLLMAKAAQAASPAPQLWAAADVTADSRSAAPVTLTLQPGLTVTGTLAFDGGAPPADLSRVRLALNPLGSGAAVELGGTLRPVAVDAENRFVFAGVVPGRYRVAIASSAGLTGWTVKSAVVAGQDSLDFPLEVKSGESTGPIVVTMTQRSTELRGTVHAATGQPTADYTVIAFPVDNRYWTPQSRRIQAMRPSTTGAFSFKDLPPGDYRLAVVPDIEPGTWFVPDVLRQLVGASTMVTLGDGEQKAQDLRVR